MFLGAGERNSCRLNAKEQSCEIFSQTHAHTAIGRYIVRSLSLHQLSRTRQPAEQLLLAMEQRCGKLNSIGNLYRNFLKEYEELNHGIRAEISQSRRARKVLSIHRVLRIKCVYQVKSDVQRVAEDKI